MRPLPAIANAEAPAARIRCLRIGREPARPERLGPHGPQAWQAHDERMREDLPGIIECLEAHGVQVDDAASLDEIRLAVRDLMVETHQIDDGASVVQCYDDFTPASHTQP